MPGNKTIFMPSRDRGWFSSIGGWWMLLSFAAAYVGGASLRLMETKKWLSPALSVAGEKLMATHDAYAYLAGAKGVSRFADDPLSLIVGFLSSVTGLSLGTVGFWLPAYMAPLAALPICVVAGKLKRPEAGLAAGTWVAVFGGFFIRSRIGYLDTDVYSLFFAVGACAGMFLWLSAACRRGLLPAWDDPSPDELSASRYWLWAVLFGLFLNLYMAAYPSGRPIIWAVIGVGAAAGMLFSRGGNRMPILVGLAIIVSIWSYGWPGVIGSGVIIAIGFYDIGLLRRKRAGVILACAFLAYFLITKGLGELEFITGLAKDYLRFGAARNQETGATPAQLPSVMQSVREAANIQLADIKNLMTGNWAWFVAGLTGVLIALIRYPLLVVFLPLLGMALLSMKIGIRFTMYGGPALGLGLAITVSELTRRINQSEVTRWAVQIAIAILFIITFWGSYEQLPAVPVLAKPYAQTFIDLKKISEEDAVLWQWWDYGYAAQYYAERETYGDGGRQSGEYLYPLALAHMTNSPRQAAQVIKLIAAERKKLIDERIARGDKPDVDAVLDFYSINPMRNIFQMDPRKAQDFIDGLAFKEFEPDVEIPEQYFVLGWDNLSLTSWISRYGSWDLAAGARPEGRFSLLPPNTEFNLNRGQMRSDGGTAALSGMVLIMENGERKHYSWPNMTGLYAIANRATGQLFVMEERVWGSMMIRMLLGDPSEFSEYFRLVVDRSPWSRAYLVK